MPTVGGLFDGCGLLAYGLHLAGWEHRWLCEVDPWRRALLALRWPGVHIYDDVRAVDAHAERVELIAGGFPCKGASTAGKREGFGHPETVLWREMARSIRELRPRFVLVENVANLLAISDGAVWDEVLGDLAALGYDTVWDCIPAAAFGAPHLRDRIICIASYSTETGGERGRGADEQPLRRREYDPARRSGDAASDPGGGRLTQHSQRDSERRRGLDGARGHDALGRGVSVEWGDFEPAIHRWEAVHGPAPEPLVRRVDDRSAARVDRSRLSALGDGVQVQLGRLAGEHLMALYLATHTPVPVSPDKSLEG